MDQIIEKISQITAENQTFFENEEFDKIQNLTFIKDLDYDQKVEAIRFVFSTNVIDNVSILNLKIILSGLQTIDSSTLKENTNLWFNSLKELCDIVVELRKEIETMSTKLFICFMGTIKSLKTSVNEGTKTKEATTTEILLLEALGFFGLSNLIKKIQDPIDLSEIPCYINTMQILYTMSNQFNILELL